VKGTDAAPLAPKDEMKEAVSGVTEEIPGLGMKILY